MVLQGQSIFDVCLQNCGTIEGVFELANQNNLSITENLITGTILQTNGVLTDDDILDYYKVKNIQPATGLTIEISEDITNCEGIGCWIIEDNFKVS
ncbi:MAG: hypothetical protein M9958_03165 [Chitinophagales bacterium]|nr:hypothetical protein [Chitinophagales bacterium]